MTPKYPEIQVQLTNTDGNAFAVLGHVHRALRHKARQNYLGHRRFW
jgi:hypothetical protein